MHGELPRAPEPALVARACERLEEREAVARGAVAEVVALLVAVAAGSPDQVADLLGPRASRVFGRDRTLVGPHGCDLDVFRLPDDKSEVKALAPFEPAEPLVGTRGWGLASQ
jgi:hypothetical protein